MSRREQIELSRQELVNILSAGIWFENILNQALLRDLMHKNPTAATTHYALTELGDETRHMVMFGKTIARIGGTPVRPRLFHRIVINSLPFVFRGDVLWGAALVGEEIFDALQRQILDDPDLQPIVSRLMRIHVTEEARHIQFARDGSRKSVPTMPRHRRFVLANLHGVGGPFYRMLFTLPIQYRRAGLDGRRMRAAAGPTPLPGQLRIVVRVAGSLLRRRRADGTDRPKPVAQGRIPVTTIVIGASRAIAGTLVADIAERCYDATTDMWTVRAADGDTVTARTVVDTRASFDHTVAVRDAELLPHTGPGRGLANPFRSPLPRSHGPLRGDADGSEIAGQGALMAPQPVAARFYLSGAAPAADDDVYDGPVAISLDGRDIAARARLTGNLAAIDGRYHWRGTLTGDLPDDLLRSRRVVSLSVAGHEVQARVVERTPWGSLTVAGDGAPRSLTKSPNLGIELERVLVSRSCDSPMPKR